MKRAFFIDRDGVINSDEGHYYIYRKEDFVFNPDIAEALSLIKEAGFLLVLITNQGGVAKGTYTENDVHEVHSFMQQKLRENHAEFDAIYYCPHHSDVSNCDCRKPKPGMILQAQKEHHISLKDSYLIGDSVRDVQAGEAAGVGHCSQVEKNTSILALVQNLIAE